MKKILQVVSCMELGGTEAFIMNNYRALDRSKYQFDFLIFCEKEYPYSEEIKKLGGRVFFSGMPSFKNLHKFTKRFKEIVKQGGPYSAVHSHVNIGNGIPLFVSYLCNIPIRISHSHDTSGNESGFLKKPWYLVKKALIKKYATEYLACSKAAGDYLYGEALFSEKGKVISNGINVSLFLDERQPEVELLKKEFSIEKNCPLIVGNISRFEDKKNSLFTVKVFKKILDYVPKAVLIMGGPDGGRLEDCKCLAKQLGIEKSVKFIGKRNDIPVCLKLIDIYLFPSLFEGLGIVLLEAQASGCFCVASDGVSTEADRGLNSVHYISLKKDETKWASEILEKYKDWKKPKAQEIVKKFTESGFEIGESHKRLKEVYDGE